MVKRPVTIRNNMDMENRPIAHLVQEASQYKSSVYIEMDDKKINAKSIMGVLLLGIKQGESIYVLANGVDEKEALDALEELASKESFED